MEQKSKSQETHINQFGICSMAAFKLMIFRLSRRLLNRMNCHIIGDIPDNFMLLICLIFP